MDITNQERLDIIKMEMGLIQSTFEKYDDIIFRSRNWFITLWMGTHGVGFTFKTEWFSLFAVILSFLYWFIEGIMRHQYWYKYVLRYRTLRDHMNKQPPDVESLSLYDLTNHFMSNHMSKKERVRKTFFKIEPSILYGAMGICSLVVWYFLKIGVIVLDKCT